MSAEVGRHKARRNAMMVLYKVDVVPAALDEAIADFQDEHGFDLPPYARQVVQLAAANRERVDAAISEHLDEWSIERLGAVERSILRIATVELQEGLVPREVAIDEAVELAKRYASPEAAKLVNGVLGAYARELAGGETGT